MSVAARICNKSVSSWGLHLSIHIGPMPGCGVAPHIMAHLFDCPKHPTYLTVHDLLDQPAKAADFIYFINYQLWQPDNTIRDHMKGYNNNNNNNNNTNAQLPFGRNRKVPRKPRNLGRRLSRCCCCCSWCGRRWRQRWWWLVCNSSMACEDDE